MFDSLNDLQVIWKNLEQVGITYLLTALIGWEREQEAHSAGLRTFPLVGMASCGYLLILGAHPNSADQSRVLQGGASDLWEAVQFCVKAPPYEEPPLRPAFGMRA